MKRIGYLYEKMYDIDYIKAAINKAAKGKRSRPHIAKILKRIDHYASKIRDMLIENNVVLSPNKQLEIYDNSCSKTRTITVPKFYPDQIIHWLIITVLQPIMEKGMYRYCCGSIPGRGGIDAKKYVETAIKDPKMRYVAKLDITKFFNSIDTNILMGMFTRKIKDKRMLELIQKVLENGGAGLPIGYYSSQWFSNFYLEGLDHFIKEKLKVRYYIRYVDDMVLIGSNKRQLHKAIVYIREYLDGIALTLKGNWQLWRLHSRPINFVGYRFYKGHTLLRKRIFFRLCRRVRNIKKAGRTTPKQAMGLLSLLGWIAHVKSYKFCKEHIRPYAPKHTLTAIVSNYNKRIQGGLQNV